MPRPHRACPRQLHNHQAYGSQPDPEGARQGLAARPAQGRRLGRRFPRKPHYRMNFFTRLPCHNPDPRRRAALRARFYRIFRRRTGFATLDRLLERLYANKEELLRVLDRPQLPLHTNGSERDLRPHVIKRKISGGTRSDQGRDCRDAFLGLLLTCAKLGVSFWDFLGHGLGVAEADAPYLPDLVRLRSATA